MVEALIHFLGIKIIFHSLFPPIEGIISLSEQEEEIEDYKSCSEADKEKTTNHFYI